MVETDTDNAEPNRPGSWACLLWDDPLIIATWSTLGIPLGALSVQGALAGRDAHVVLLPSWTLETAGTVPQLARDNAHHVDSNPGHRILAAGNTEAEVAALAVSGLDSLQLNSNCLLDDEAFRPLDGVTPRFDAVYNARLSPGKRHELACDLRSLALVYFRAPFEHDAGQFHTAVTHMKRQLPNAAFINPLTDDGCRRLSPEEVNDIYAQSRVGLCLSAVEGACRASIEYLMAGLPVVSTRSLGGRDYFFDPEYCIIVDDDPAAVRDAVDALVRREIPRNHIRNKTLERVRRERQHLIDAVQGMIDAAGRPANFAERFDVLLRGGGSGIFRWRDLREFLAEIPPATHRSVSGS